MSGGGGNVLGSALPLGLAIAATVATDGAAAPSIGEALGAEAGSTGAAMLGSGVIGAGTGALTNALTGRNVLQGALTGGATGAATAGIMGAMSAPSGETPTPTQVSDNAPAPGGITNAPTMMNAAYTPNAVQTPTTPLTPVGIAPEGSNPGDIINNGKQIVGSDGNTYNYSDVQKAIGTTPSKPGFISNLGESISKNPGTALAGAGLLSMLAMQPKPQQAPVASDPNAPQYTFNQVGYRPAIPTPPANPYVAQYGPGAAPKSMFVARAGGIAKANAYATGGPIEQMSNQNAVGDNPLYPQAGVPNNTGLTNPINIPVSTNMLSGIGDTKVDPYSGEPQLAGGGIVGYAGGGSLGGYSDGGRMLKGPGDGMSDSIPASIANKQPARLADSEFVVPADVVSHLGNGSSDAGAKKLYKMMDNVRKARTGKKKQAPEITADKYLPK